MPAALFLRLRKAAEIAGIEPEVLDHMREVGHVETSVIPGSARQFKVYRRSDMERLREQIERGFETVVVNRTR